MSWSSVVPPPTNPRGEHEQEHEWFGWAPHDHIADPNLQDMSAIDYWRHAGLEIFSLQLNN